MKSEIINYLTWYANQVAQTVQYPWNDEFCRKEIKEAHDKLIDELKKHINISHLTKEEAIELRFGRWSDETPNLYLIPLWLLPIIPVGTELTSIFGNKIVYDGANIDTDIRFGCLAYGIEIDK